MRRKVRKSHNGVYEIGPRSLAAEGYPVKRAALRLTSPYLTDHLNRFGEYVVDMGIAAEDIQLVMNLPDLD